jgi:hypothetical protein
VYAKSPRLVFASPEVGEVALPEGVAPPARDFDLAFRPHAVEPGPAGADAQTGKLRLAGAIEAAEFLGGFVRYDVRVGTALVVADVPHARGRRVLETGTPVTLAVVADELRFVTG